MPSGPLVKVTFDSIKNDCREDKNDMRYRNVTELSQKKRVDISDYGSRSARMNAQKASNFNTTAQKRAFYFNSCHLQRFLTQRHPSTAGEPSAQGWVYPVHTPRQKECDEQPMSLYIICCRLKLEREVPADSASK